MSIPNNHTILIVDDEQLNVKMMGAMLSREGYRILEAHNGKEALLKVKEHPDLILLDIMMPVLDGFETCRLLKEDETVGDIPVIFLSALQDSKTKISGFNLGGVDYISKPFQREELLARVKTHLTIREQKLRLQDYNDRLETMVEERTAQLVHADRLATLGTLVAAVAHEINNPLQAVVGNVDLALLELDELKENPDPSSSQTGQNFVKDQAEHIGHNLQEIRRGAQKLKEIINTLKTFGKKGTGRKEFFPIILPIQEVLGIMRAKLKTSVTVNLQIPKDLVCYGNKQQFSQIFINLIHNAVDALAGREGTLSISAESDEARQVIIDVKDSGQGIPEDLFDSIFDPFFTTKNESEGTGLGLFITRQIIEQHQGSIHPVHHQGAGAWFRITLPNPD